LTGIACGVAVAAALLVLAGHAAAADKVRVASTQKGFWDTTLIIFGIEKGIFRDAGLDVDVLWTDAGSDAQQAVISGSVDIAYDSGLLGVLSAWDKGAPIDIISAAATGATDYLWYVKAQSPLHDIKDLTGKSIAFSRPGSSNQLMIQQLLTARGMQANLVSTGNAPATLTAVMSGQVDVGFMVPPFNFDRLERGDIRILFTGKDIPGVTNQTVRVHAANRTWLDSNPGVAQRFIDAMRKTVDWAYSTDEALAMWAKMHDLPLEQARKARDVGYPKSMLAMTPIGDLDTTVAQAVESKRLTKPLEAARKVALTKWLDQLNK
jgi:NitT/TauT family transport system substrate-binding protein